MLMKNVHQPYITANVSEDPQIDRTSHIMHSYCGSWTSIGPNNKVIESQIGDYSYTMDDVTINYADIGKYCSIASHVCINPVNHPMERVTQHHMTYRRASYGLGQTDDESIFDWRRSNRVTIDHDVWVGHGAIIMKGVHIGTGAVVGSGAVVTKDVEPYTIVVGVPAKPINKRFSSDLVKKLLQITWWDWSRELLEERFDELNDVERFVEKYYK